MEPFSNVAQKIVLLLEKTRDSLILDLEKEFAGIRKAIEQLETTANGKADLLANLDQGVSAGYKVVDAVFTRIGLDLSGGANTQKLTELAVRTANCYTLANKILGNGTHAYARNTDKKVRFHIRKSSKTENKNYIFIP